MTELHLRGERQSALTHLMQIGFAAILEASGVSDVRVSWSGALDARPLVWTDGVDFDQAALLVRDHARRRADASSWLAADIDLAGRRTGLFSPRIKPPEDRGGWQRLIDAREAHLDGLTAAQARLDLQFIGALGMPAYWRVDRTGRATPDDGASRWEMKARNAGEEFVRHRLFPIARHVAGREARSIREGLEGAITCDLTDPPRADSRTATGLAAPGPTDTAVAWCALWAISQFPIMHLVAERSRAAGHVAPPRGRGRFGGWFYLPMAEQPMGLPRLRSVLVSRPLERVARAAVGSDTRRVGPLGVDAARAWLRNRGVSAIVVFPISVSANKNAPEYQARDGTVVPLDV